MKKDQVDRLLDQAGVPRSEAGTIEVLGRLYRLMAFIEKRLAEAYRSAGLNRGEVDVLNALLRGGDVPQNPGVVAASLMCSSGAMTNRLDRLERAGFLRRQHGTDDRRSVRLSITPEGRKAAQRANAAREAIAADLLPGLSSADRNALVGLLRRMLIEFEADDKGAA
ncbi:MAG TPA: MarR family transcriptional regulator [Candidatus Acidoferrum sp.]|nr:MarR family transcriptional regulator [Candidatus Acidoferrum sp.]